MESLRTQICCVCLNNERKIVKLADELKKQCFLRIILDISDISSVIQISLCWECDALLTRFTKFKLQAQKSYKYLHNVTEIQNNKTKTALQIHKQYKIDLLPNNNETDVTSIKPIKTEINDIDTNDYKEEYINKSDNNYFSDDYSDDDDKTLIEISGKKKKTNNLKKKRLKKEKNTEHYEIKKEIEYYKEIELTDQEIEEERRRLETREEYVNAVFRCERCIVSFPNDDDLKDHIHLKHNLNAKAWKCERCECTFGSQVAFNYHANKHTRRYQCTTCLDLFAYKRAAVKHYEMTHTIRAELDYNGEPNKNENKDTEVNMNGVTNSATSLFPCDLCDKTFKFRTSLRKHVEKHRIETGQKRRPYCEPCRLTFSGTSNLQKHVKCSSKHQIQLKLRKMKAESQLPESTPETLACIEQIRSSVNTGRELFSCAMCDRKFQWRGNLLRHMQSHKARANGELVCEPCNRTFSSIATYKQHMKQSRKHVSENDFKYVCTYCGKKFANKTRLKDHVDWEHLKNYVHKCSDCGKVFKSHTSLYLHKQVVHKKDNVEHLCDHCGKPFPNRAKLRSHVVALHSAQAPYSCATCGARFSWHSCLSRHVRRVHKASLHHDTK